MARGPLRPPLRMRLEINRWSSSRTALDLIPDQRVRPAEAYFRRAGHLLLDSLTHSLLEHRPARQLEHVPAVRSTGHAPAVTASRLYRVRLPVRYRTGTPCA